MKDLFSAYSAIAAGALIGFGLLVPFGGLNLGKAANKDQARNTIEFACDIMGCKAVPANGPSGQ